MKQIAHLPHGPTGHNQPDIIVVHAMGEFIHDLEYREHAIPFLNRYGYSAHSLISPDGINYRCRDDTEMAYHARGYNTNTLGIECLVAGEHDYASFLEAIKHNYMPALQYASLLEQIQEWVSKFEIKRIVKHSTLSPGRKVDPGDGFPWDRLMKDIGPLPLN